MLRCPKRGPDLLKVNTLLAKLKPKPRSFARAPGALVLNMLKKTIIIIYFPNPLAMLEGELEAPLLCTPVQNSK